MGTFGQIHFRVGARTYSRDFDGRRRLVPSLTQDVYLGRGSASPHTAAAIRRAL